MTWFAWAVVAAFGWGVWGLLSGVASQESLFVGLGVAVLAESAVVLGWVSVHGWDAAGLTSRTLWAGTGAGVAAGVAYGAMYLALHRGVVSQVVALTSLYPALTLVLSLGLLHEELTFRKCFGVALAVVAAILLGGS